jgi:hypothetical protein
MYERHVAVGCLLHGIISIQPLYSKRTAGGTYLSNVVEQDMKRILVL